MLCHMDELINSVFNYQYIYMKRELKTIHQAAANQGLTHNTMTLVIIEIVVRVQFS